MRITTIDNRAEIESAFAAFPSGVAALTADVDGVPTGFVSTTFTVGISFDPPQVLCSVMKTSRTWPALRRAERIGVSVLAQGHEVACMQLASRSRDRFAGLDLVRGDGGALLISDAVMWLECSLDAEYDSGDHTVVILAVERMHVAENGDPLVYHGRNFRNLARSAAVESVA